MMKLTTFAVLTAATAAIPAGAFAQLPTSKVLTLDVAQTIAQEALAKCRADGYKVSVLVVDGLNAPKAMVRDDGATASTTESTLRSGGGGTVDAAKAVGKLVGERAKAAGISSVASRGTGGSRAGSPTRWRGRPSSTSTPTCSRRRATRGSCGRVAGLAAGAREAGLEL